MFKVIPQCCLHQPQGYGYRTLSGHLGRWTVLSQYPRGYGHRTLSGHPDRWTVLFQSAGQSPGIWNQESGWSPASLCDHRPLPLSALSKASMKPNLPLSPPQQLSHESKRVRQSLPIGSFILTGGSGNGKTPRTQVSTPAQNKK